MTDIVERLRNRAFAATIIKDKSDLYSDAADAIIRLIEENERLRTEIEWRVKQADMNERILTQSGELRQLNIDLRADNERLQKYEALVQFIAYDYYELSYDKAKWQRDDWRNRCRKLIEEEAVASPLNA